jgi:hypothetical protein
MHYSAAMAMTSSTERTMACGTERAEPAAEVLKEALSLATLLCDRLCLGSLREQADPFRIRLIRAQALSVADLLTELIALSAQTVDARPSSVAACGVQRATEHRPPV